MKKYNLICTPMIIHVRNILQIKDTQIPLVAWSGNFDASVVFQFAHIGKSLCSANTISMGVCRLLVGGLYLFLFYYFIVCVCEYLCVCFDFHGKLVSNNNWNSTAIFEYWIKHMSYCSHVVKQQCATNKAHLSTQPLILNALGHVWCKWGNLSPWYAINICRSNCQCSWRKHLSNRMVLGVNNFSGSIATL